MARSKGSELNIKLKGIMTANRWTNYNLQEITGVNSLSVSRWLAGEHNIRKVNLEKIIKNSAFHLEIEDILHMNAETFLRKYGLEQEIVRENNSKPGIYLPFDVDASSNDKKFFELRCQGIYLQYHVAFQYQNSLACTLIRIFRENKNDQNYLYCNNDGGFAYLGCAWPVYGRKLILFGKETTEFNEIEYSLCSINIFSPDHQGTLVETTELSGVTTGTSPANDAPAASLMYAVRISDRVDDEKWKEMHESYSNRLGKRDGNRPYWANPSGNYINISEFEKSLSDKNQEHEIVMEKTYIKRALQYFRRPNLINPDKEGAHQNTVSINHLPVAQ